MKNTSFVKSVVALVMGLLLALLSIDMLFDGGGHIATGIVGLLAGGAFIAYGVIKIVFGKSERNGPRIFDESLVLACFLLFFFVYTLVEIITYYNYGINVGPVDWIFAISIMTVSIVGTVFAIIAFVSPKKVMLIIKDASFGMFIALFITALSYGFLRMGGTIGNLPITMLVFVSGFAYLAYQSLSVGFQNLRNGKSPEEESAPSVDAADPKPEEEAKDEAEAEPIEKTIEREIEADEVSPVLTKEEDIN